MSTRITAVEVAVAATSSTFKGSRIRRSSSRTRHELATAIKGKATKSSSMVFEAFFVGHHHLEGRWLGIQRAIRER